MRIAAESAWSAPNFKEAALSNLITSRSDEVQARLQEALEAHAAA